MDGNRDGWMEIEMDGWMDGWAALVVEIGMDGWMDGRIGRERERD